MRLNIAKRKRVPNPTYKLRNMKLKNSQCTINLGVIFDKNLTLVTNLNHITVKTEKLLDFTIR